MATPSRQLIDLLLRTADDIETNPDYNWEKTEACNCGMLAKNAGCPVIIDNCFVVPNTAWRRLAYQICPRTGIPLIEAVRVLMSYGLTAKDITELERCNNQEICEIVPMSRDYENSIYVAQYLRAWASLLNKQLIPQSSASLQPALTQSAGVLV